MRICGDDQYTVETALSTGTSARQVAIFPNGRPLGVVRKIYDSSNKCTLIERAVANDRHGATTVNVIRRSGGAAELVPAEWAI